MQVISIRIGKHRERPTSVALDTQAIWRLDGLARSVNLTREQNVMEFIKCFLPNAKVEISRISLEGK